ncbi:hypothetical protein [Paraburkholderia guartelaensis]|uniref:hypothetical protein n=1 Tax=Paraburkholderia guartelaensis TaxID=2546446 RepID=UPI002AB6ACE3|nr:hypothetical protein [Paraburkholderia guartelaensis]
MNPVQCASRTALAGLCVVLGMQATFSQTSPQAGSAALQPNPRPNQLPPHNLAARVTAAKQATRSSLPTRRLR